jgi:inosine-uridine nucleoside N-ribohydrolase
VTAIILDCDPGRDDAVALLLALASDEVQLLGVTTVAGTQTVDETTAGAIRVLDCAGRPDVPVAAGASRPLAQQLDVGSELRGASSLDGAGLPPPSRGPAPTHAIDWMAARVASASTPVTLVATGPLTNIALLLARYPELETRIQGVVFMGGAIAEGNVTPAAEFNVWTDPEAAQRVFSSSVDLTMVGLDVTQKALLTGAHLETLARSGPLGRVVAELYYACLPFYRKRYGWDGAPVHDAVALAHVIDGSLLTTELCGVLVDTGPGPSRGRTHVDLRRQMDWSPARHVATEIDAGRFLTLLVERIAALDRSRGAATFRGGSERRSGASTSDERGTGGSPRTHVRS